MNPPIPDGSAYPINAADRTRYRLVTRYPTIQGEGGQAGTPMALIRLQGCPVGCVWCDTPESWTMEPQAGLVAAGDLAAWARATGLQWALVTGGEPCWHDLTELSHQLRQAGLQRALETSGVYSVSGIWNWVCVSPKPAGRLPLDPTCLLRAHEIKWIVGRAADVAALDLFLIQWRDALAVSRPRVSVQPVSCAAVPTRLCLEAVQARPQWRLSLQTHKYVGIA